MRSDFDLAGAWHNIIILSYHISQYFVASMPSLASDIFWWWGKLATVDASQAALLPGRKVYSEAVLATGKMKEPKTRWIYGQWCWDMLRIAEHIQTHFDSQRCTTYQSTLASQARSLLGRESVASGNLNCTQIWKVSLKRLMSQTWEHTNLTQPLWLHIQTTWPRVFSVGTDGQNMYDIACFRHLNRSDPCWNSGSYMFPFVWFTEISSADWGIIHNWWTRTHYSRNQLWNATMKVHMWCSLPMLVLVLTTCAACWF